MSAITQVYPSMVAKLEIKGDCTEKMPCKHGCKVVLFDGREKEVTLRVQDIDSLIHSIASENIVCRLPKAHFSKYKFDEAADVILTRIFSEKPKISLGSL